MDRFETDVAVIGAGAVGLATARAIALSGREVILLESASAFGTETSSRNSEVVHAGLYYRTGSFKARFCVAGRRALYAYCAERGIEARRTGKLVVACDTGEADALAALHARSLENGVEGLALIDGAAARALEPALSEDVVAAIRSDESGVFDSHGYMLALLGDLEAAGGSVAFVAPALRGALSDRGVELELGGASPALLTARTLVNSAGHGAIPLARMIDGIDPSTLPTPRAVTGHEFSVSGKTPLSRLIYPMPTSASLGLHLTVDLAGRGRLGPDVEWLAPDVAPPFDYRPDASRAPAFYEAVRRYWPGLADGALYPDYAGVRPKIVGPGEPSGDFVFHRIAAGQGAYVGLYGIESPGLTSSLAIADHVASLV